MHLPACALHADMLLQDRVPEAAMCLCSKCINRFCKCLCWLQASPNALQMEKYLQLSIYLSNCCQRSSIAAAVVKHSFTALSCFLRREHVH